MTVTVDSTAYSADATWPSADGFVPTNIVFADLSEPVGGHVTADTTAYTADATWPTADGGILPGADDVIDATVIAGEIEIPVGGGRYYPLRPLPVYGIGYGVLPELEGEAHGVVGVAGKSAAQLLVRADALGACGQAGNATVVLKGLSVAGNGAIGTRGVGEGMIVKFNGTATGRHDDDEAAVIAFLLAA